MTRLLTVTRVQLLAWRTVIGWPWGVLAIAFVVNLSLAAGFAALRSFEGWPTGGLAPFVVVLFIGHALAVARALPFALAMGVTRRGFYGATVLAAGLESVVHGSLLYLLHILEDATGGWGLDLAFFGFVPLSRAGALLQWLLCVVSVFVVTMLGLCVGAAVKRAGMWALLGLSAMGAVGGVLLSLLARSDRWVAIGNWSLLAVAGWSLLAAAVLAVAGYLALRRAPA